MDYISSGRYGTYYMSSARHPLYMCKGKKGDDHYQLYTAIGTMYQQTDIIVWEILEWIWDAADINTWQPEVHK